MRLFYAIALGEEVKDALTGVQKSLEPLVERARWTRREHMHLTLVFLGEIAPRRAEEAVRILNALDFPLSPLRSPDSASSGVLAGRSAGRDCGPARS